ncbi:MAG: c-type cytochrome [Planctomycetes bacterium]|nr:c-type cytochrome [Planctomycetota bacterium]
MKRLPHLFVCAAFVCVVTQLSAAPGIAPTEALKPEDQRKLFHLPPGFEIQLVVADPDIGQPMNLNFDARGRLWITHSIEYPYPARGDVEPRSRFPGQGDHDPRDSLTVVEGIGADGRPTKITHFAGGLNIPIGNTPLGDGSTALVYGIPNIYRVADTDGDGVSDTRDVLYGKFGNIDTHGMASSFRPWLDGWIYGCHGFSNTSVVRDGSGHVTTMNSGNTYRFRADGSRFEQRTWGQVNPFGMTFDVWGNLFDSDCHSMPIYMLLRGGYYPSFGKPDDGLGFAPAMIDHGHGSTGICGPAYYGAEQFPEGHRGSIYICNPVNCVVHHDRLKQVGSTFLIDTQPDLVTCDDGWFRPVDLTVGPDGALYIADFYNCIIGHYEVPLEHPRRDRTHGRVWRVVYKGEDGQAKPPRALPDLTKEAIEKLVQELADANLTVRTMATNWLVDAVQNAPNSQREQRRAETCNAVRVALNSDQSRPEQRAHGLWVVERLEGLNASDVARLKSDKSPLVQTHLIRAFAEREKWTEMDVAMVQGFLKHDNAIVRRVAADALGLHPQVNNVSSLFALLKETPAEDTHLVHVARMALRDQLRDEAVLTALSNVKLGEPQLKTLAELAVSVKTPAAADLVLDYLDRFGKDDPRAAEYVAFAGQYASEARVELLAGLIRSRYADNPGYQFQQLQSIHTGLERRGVRDNKPIQTWARELTDRLLKVPVADSVSWTSIPATGAVIQGDPWVRQKRASADGNTDATFWCSLPRGERLMGTLRSGSFDIPARLSFFSAGHNGPTDKPEVAQNFIRLRDAQTGEMLMESKPPRNDTAQRTEWDLSRFAGRRGSLELVDAFDATGFAWLAVGRFSLPVLNDEQFRSQAAAMELVSQFKLIEFRPALEAMVKSPDVSLATRRQAAESLVSLSPDARVAAILSMVNDGNGTATNEKVLAATLSRDAKAIAESLGETMLRAPRETQRSLAETLASDRSGAEALLELAANGKASPRLLLDPVVRNRLNALKLEKLNARIATLTAQLPNENEQLLKLIDERRAQFSSTSVSAEKGVALFEKHCAACHQVAGKGQKVGPQLDGIGARGLARLVEDVLDPNRNVDPAFRATTLQMSDGRVLVGLIRRNEGATIVLADNKGKEFTVAKSDIDEQQLSTLSLMPANFGESLPAEEFQQLMGFLLMQQKKPE